MSTVSKQRGSRETHDLTHRISQMIRCELLLFNCSSIFLSQHTSLHSWYKALIFFARINYFVIVVCLSGC